MNPARDRDPVARTEEARVAEHQRRREMLFLQQPLWPVQIAQQQIEHARPLNRAQAGTSALARVAGSPGTGKRSVIAATRPRI